MKIRLFIETKEVTLPLQMSNFIQDMDGVVNILFICSDKLSEKWLEKNSNIVFKYNESTLLPALDKIKEQRIQKNLVSAACEEKIVAMTLDDKRDELSNEALVKEQKAVDEIAAQCWLRQKTLGVV